MVNYNDNINEINEKFPDIEVENYFGYDNEELYDSYFQFCQSRLDSINLLKHRVLFYYSTQTDKVMACVDHGKSPKLLAVTKGTVGQLNHIFSGTIDIFNSNSELKNWFGDLSINLKIPIGSLMYQCSTAFIFRHELTHLIQRENKRINLAEEDHHDVASNGIFKYQIRELDADTSGAFFVCAQLLSYFKTLDVDMRSNANLEKLLTIGISSIFVYLLLFCKDNIEIYYNENRHPHPIVRLSYIVDNFILFAVRNLKRSLTINSLMIINNCLNVSEIINVKIFNSEIVQNISDIFAIEKENIKSHILNLLNASLELPELEMNATAPNMRFASVWL